MKVINKVIFIVPSMRSGGAERVIATLANNFVVDCSVELWLMVDAQVEYTLSSDITVNSEYTEIQKGGIRRLRWLIQRLRKEKNAVVISFMTKMNLYAILAAKATGKRVVVSERNDPARTISPKRFWLRNLIYRWADSIVFQTQGAMDFFPQSVRKKGTLILNPLRKNIPEPYVGARDQRIVTVSRLHPQKNLKLLIDAFCRFSADFPTYQLVIYGEGPSESELKEEVRRKGLERKVLFAGFDENVLTKIATASMFVISSDFEGLSNALLEAMAMGLPCISTDSPPGGARMVIHSGVSGILIPVGDSEKLTEAMLLFAKNPELAERMGKEAARIRNRLSEDMICKQWKNVIMK